ncbi:MAG TPA: hypothetical protein VHM26_16610 [Chitinophagaceae bacterium]|nr:hypothetical protein [Chitinophagaceae bacterium]
MQTTFKTLLLFTVLGLVIAKPARCQVKLAIEAGVTYHSNDASDSASHLADFFAFTINPRIILNSSGNSALALEIPFSLRAKRNENITNRFGMHLPLLLTYSIGSGSGGSIEYTSTTRFGATAGFGWGYFYQRSRSVKTESNVYNENLRSSGPEIQMGLRFPLKKQMVLFDRERPTSTVLAIKGNYLFNIKNRDRDVSSLSILLGFNF